MRLRVRKSFRHNDPFYVARKLYHTTQTTARPLSPTPGRVINSGMTALMSCRRYSHISRFTPVLSVLARPAWSSCSRSALGDFPVVFGHLWSSLVIFGHFRPSTQPTIPILD